MDVAILRTSNWGVERRVGNIYSQHVRTRVVGRRPGGGVSAERPLDAGRGVHTGPD